MPTNREERDACLAVTLSSSPSGAEHLAGFSDGCDKLLHGRQRDGAAKGRRREEAPASGTSVGSSWRECGDHRHPAGSGTATEERSVGEKEELNDERMRMRGRGERSRGSLEDDASYRPRRDKVELQNVVGSWVEL